MKKPLLKLSVMALIVALMVSFLPAQVRPVYAVSTSVVISQVYGGGGNSGAPYNQDFVELYNMGSSAVSLVGWSIQYASATGTGNFGANPVTSLTGSIDPGHYHLVKLASGANGVALPAADDSGTVNMSGTGGKVALVNSTTGLACNGGSTPCSADQLAQIVDLLGWGTANFYEGAVGPTTSNTTADLRANGGCTDTDNNATDFAAGVPAPRNSASAAHYCSATTNPSGIGLANPATLFAGDATLLTVAVTAGTNPTSSGLAVACDLSAINGAAAQTFYDDGTNGDATAGDKTFSFSTTVAAGTTAGVKSMACTITDAQFRTGSASIGLTVTAILSIGVVQGVVNDSTDGATFKSPYAGQSVTIQGVIYENAIQPASFGGYYGFFIQNTAATADGDPNTSDGIYVFMNTKTSMNGPNGPYTPTVGDEVIISGTISEYYFMTELSNPTLMKLPLRSGVDLEAEIPPVVADPPADLQAANRYWERIEGMRAQIPASSIVLGGRNVFSPPDGEIWVARSDSTIGKRTEAYKNRAFRDAHPLDDNYDPTAWDGNGYRMLMGSWGLKANAKDATLLIDPGRTFDTLTNAPAGGVNYTFSKYRVEITAQPVFSEGLDPAANNPPQVIARSQDYSIADYNLENLYDFRDNPASGCDFVGNSGCPKVDPFLSAVAAPYDYVPASDAAYQKRLGDIASQIITDLHSPDILMVQEVENQDICVVDSGALVCGTTDNADGKPDVLQELALKVASLGGPAYDAAFDRNSSDLRGIAPAFLYRTDRVELVDSAGDPVLGANPAISYAGAGVAANADVSNPKTLNAVVVLPAGVKPCETNWVFPRAPDVGLFRIYKDSIGDSTYRDVYVINNHFKSGPDTCVEHRTEQAKYNAALVAFIQAANPTARIVVGGDLNVYPRPDDPFAPIGKAGSSDQLGSLYDPSLGLKNLWEVLRDQHPEAAYSYVYLGMAQTLDQMFVNQYMTAHLDQFRIAHVNSDFAADYPDDTGRGTSDHDPNVATFVFSLPPTADAGGPYTVDEGSSVTLSASGTDPEGGALSYAWDLDNNGTFESAGQSVSFTGLDGPATKTVKVQVTAAGSGLTAVVSATVTVNNVAPTVGALVFTPATTLENKNVVASATFSDPAGDLDMPFTCTVNYGDSLVNWPGVVSGNTCSGPAHAYPKGGVYTVTVRVTDKDGGTGSNTGVHGVLFKWTGFYSPVKNPPAFNTVKAGSAVPVKFSLGKYEGMNIFAPGYPQYALISCTTGAALGGGGQTNQPGATSLFYHPGNMLYTYLWKTNKAWAGSCVQLMVKLVDGTTHLANFKFK